MNTPLIPAPANESLPKRADLIVTTALKFDRGLEKRAKGVARELGAHFVPRRALGMAKLFPQYPDAVRALIVQTDRMLLVSRDGHELFYHPNLAHLRMGNLLRGGRDLLIDAAELRPGDSVLDGTLGYAGEAILCAHIVGDTGEVHGVEAVPELGIIVREGLQTVQTENEALNAAMRRVRVVYLGNHLEYLRTCPDARYDVVCFDPFFDEMLHESRPMGPLRAFGDLSGLLPEAVEEARRVARRSVIVKAEKHSTILETLGVTQFVTSKSSKVVYGVLPAISR